MEQVTIYYKDNPKDYKALFNYAISRAPKWKRLLIVFMYVLNFLMILMVIGVILLGVLYAKLPLKAVIEENQETLSIVIFATFFMHTSIYIGYRQFCKKLWKFLLSNSKFKIKSITFRENDMSIQMITEDKEVTPDIEYLSFTKIKQRRNCILFLDNENVAFFCPKQYFTEDEWDIVSKWLK